MSTWQDIKVSRVNFLLLNVSFFETELLPIFVRLFGQVRFGFVASEAGSENKKIALFASASASDPSSVSVSLSSVIRSIHVKWSPARKLT